MKYSVMIAGGKGMLGKELSEQFPKLLMNDEVEIYDYDKESCDIKYYCDLAENVNYVSKEHFGSKNPHPYIFFINCAAITKLGRCLEHPKEALMSNALALKNLITLQQYNFLKIFHISTDYVFNGTKGNYSEDDCCDPISYYAKTKWAGEVVLDNAINDRIRIIRTSFCRKDQWLHPQAFQDKYTSGDYVNIIAHIIASAIIRNYKWVGTLHVGTERKTFYDLAKGISPNVNSCSVKEHKDIPVDTSFNLSKLNGIYK